MPTPTAIMLKKTFNMTHLLGIECKGMKNKIQFITPLPTAPLPLSPTILNLTRLELCC